MASKHVSLLLSNTSEGKTNVLLSVRGAFTYAETSPKSQPFQGGRQIFPGGRVEEGESPMRVAIRKLREKAGDKACEYIISIIRPFPKRLVEVNENCFALQLTDKERQEFMEKINLSPENVSTEWCPVDEIEGFADLSQYENGVPKDVRAIFKDEVASIKRFAELLQICLSN